MVSEDLLFYIKQQKKRGYTKAQLRPVILEQGYSQQEVDDAFDSIEPGAIKQRDITIGLLLTIFTLGVYPMYWLVSTTKELQANHTDAPSPLLLWLVLLLPIAPFVMAYYFYQYAVALEQLTSFSKWGLFLALLFVYPVGYVLAQLELNKQSTTI